ncbi:hypothetical protein L916_04673 [Phytophthora nicotianae]|uniref:Uncharacterized protein n=1 Tax=Phytophthora nicotianae TaxID=4792 RepID=W2JHG5_PHYNI|nr:hypothetical protein L916_04673 [Phytophthora nicotianae]
MKTWLCCAESARTAHSSGSEVASWQRGMPLQLSLL